MKSNNDVHNKIADTLYLLTTPYRFMVIKINKLVQPVLERITANYVKDAITRNNAEDNPILQHLLKTEIERRGLGTGQTQDVAEPIFWQGIKIAGAICLPPITKSLEQYIDNNDRNKIMWLSKGVCAGIIIKESIDFFRLVGRFSAGLEGSEQMALYREKNIQENGTDPFIAIQSPSPNINNATSTNKISSNQDTTKIIHS